VGLRSRSDRLDFIPSVELGCEGGEEEEGGFGGGGFGDGGFGGDLERV
jgi:hypothetical protein